MSNASAVRHLDTTPWVNPPSGDLALALVAALLSAPDAQTGMNQLVREVARAFPGAQVSLALLDGPHLKMRASTGSLAMHADSERGRWTLSAMDEALDQSRIIQAGVDQSRVDAGLSFAHQRLVELTQTYVTSLPFGLSGQGIGVMLLETASSLHQEAGALPNFILSLSILAPILRMLQVQEQSWTRRLRDKAMQAWRDLRTPQRFQRRRRLAIAAAILVALAVIPLPDHVGGHATIEGAEQQLLVAPTDGFVKKAWVRAGDQVKAEQVLVDLQEQDLALEHDKWAGQLAEHQSAYAAQMNQAELAQAAISLAKISEAQAQLALIDEQRQRVQIKAPFDGLVIQGDLSQSEGAPVHQGDALMTVAKNGQYRVVINVDEKDIGRIRIGQRGQVAVSAWPWDHWDIVVDRITPLAKVVDAANVFEVQARLTSTDTERLRPGLIGQAEVSVGQTPVLWSWLANIARGLHQWWWKWSP